MMSNDEMKSVRRAKDGIEFLITAALGAAALILPVVMSPAHRAKFSAERSFMANVAKELDVKVTPILLVLLGAGAGAFGISPLWRIGLASVASLYLWSVADMVGGGDHNLFPIEWTSYAMFGGLALIGAFMVRRTRYVSDRIAERMAELR